MARGNGDLTPYPSPLVERGNGNGNGNSNGHS
jgi:hypothetical protein